MRKTVIVLILAVLALSLTADERGEAIVKRALAAHGFSAAEHKRFALTYKATSYDSDQSLRPFEPATPQPLRIDGTVDLEGERLSFRFEMSFDGGFDFHWRLIQRPDAGWVHGELVNRLTSLPEPVRKQNWARAEPYLLPVLLNRLARHVSEARLVSENAVSVSGIDGEPVTLHFDRESGLLSRYDTESTDALRGKHVTAYHYEEYKRAGGVMLPRRVRVMRGSERIEEGRVSKAEWPASIDDATFAPPAGLEARTFGKPSVERVADGVYFVRNLAGFYNAFFIELGGGLVAVDVPMNEQVAQAALSLVETVAPGKPVRHAVYTHYHLDHAGSAAALAKRGATIVTTPGNREFFQKLATNADITEVTDKLVLGDAVEIHKLRRTPHVDEMLIVHHRPSGIVFDGDLYSTLVPPNETAQFFVDELARLGLAPAAIYGAHHERVSAAEIRTALEAKAKRDDAPRARLAELAGDFDVTIEERGPCGEWSSKNTTLTGRWMVDGRYVELRGRYPLAGFEKPVDMPMIWSWDPFQKEFRLAVLDDVVGLLDVFEQEEAQPLTLSNVAHGTYFSLRPGRRSFSRVMIEFPAAGTVKMNLGGSTDGGETWQPLTRMTLRKRVTDPPRASP